MAIPDVGPVTAITFIAAIDDPARFRRSRDIAADVAAPSVPATSIDVQGGLSKAGDADVCSALRGGIRI